MKIHLWKSSSCCAADEQDVILVLHLSQSLSFRLELYSQSRKNGKTSTEYTTAAISQTK